MTRLLVQFLALSALACGRVFDYPAGEPERGGVRCQDGIDNDFDQLADCDDPGCIGHCPEESVTACSDEWDNDDDGLVDAADPRCWRHFPPKAQRCASAWGIEIAEDFSALDNSGLASSWRGDATGLPRPFDDGRSDPVLAFRSNTTGLKDDSTSKTKLESSLWSLWHNRAFSGTWEEFDLGLSVAIAPGAILRVGIVPVDDTPTPPSSSTGSDADSALVLTLDHSQSPPLLVFQVGQERSTKQLPKDAPCHQHVGETCTGELVRVRVRLNEDGFLAAVRAADNEPVVEARLPTPRSLSLPTSRLVLWGGSSSPSLLAAVDDLRLWVSPEWPCGFPVPQIRSESCHPTEASTALGQQLSLAQSLNGDFCALVTRGPGLSQPPNSLGAWKSGDGETWTATSAPDEPALEVPDGSTLVGAAIASNDKTWHLAVATRKRGTVALAFAENEQCGAWDSFAPGPVLFEDTEAPSYVIEEGRHQIYFTRPPNDEVRRTLWRIDRDGKIPELLAELPTSVGAPVSITRVGTQDLVLTFPTSLDSAASGAGFLVSNGNHQHWDPVGPSPLLRLPDRLESYEGQVAFDDRGLVAATSTWGSSGGLLLYSGLSAYGWAGDLGEAAFSLSAGTAWLAIDNEALPNRARIAENACGDDICSAEEHCTTCPKDCACGGPVIVSDAFSDPETWQWQMGTLRDGESPFYLTSDPPAWGVQFALGSNWSMHALEHPITADFELSFDVVDYFTSSACFLDVGLGQAASQGIGIEGLFAGLGTNPLDCGDRYAAVPYIRLSPQFTFLDQIANWDQFVAWDWEASESCEGPTFPERTRQHVVLRREGDQLSVLVPQKDGCGTSQVTTTIRRPVPPLTSLLLGTDYCQDDRSAGIIENLELRLLDDPAACPQGKQLCDSGPGEPSCVDASSSTQHCGSCDRVCPGLASCRDGECTCADLPEVIDCDGDCADSLNSTEHCGGCGRPCSVCSSGRCDGPVFSCTHPFPILPDGENLFLYGDAAADTLTFELCGEDAQYEGLLVATWTPANSGNATVSVVSFAEAEIALGFAEVTADPICGAWTACETNTAGVGVGAVEVTVPVSAGTAYRIEVGAKDFSEDLILHATVGFL